MFRSSIAQMLLALFCVAMPLTVSAATINVTTTADEYGTGAQCSLREAIAASISKVAFGGCTAGSNSLLGDFIMLPAGIYAITRPPVDIDDLYSGDFDLDDADLTIVGAGAGQTIIDGQGLDRVFQVYGNSFVGLSKLTIRGGDPTSAYPNSPYGGAIEVRGGYLVLQDVVLTGNHAVSGGGLYMNSTDTLTIRRSTISDNTATDGAGISILSASTITIENTTVSGNRAQTAPGGIDFGLNGNFTLNNVTVAYNTSGLNGNTAVGGAGLYTGYSNAPSRSVNIRNSLIARNVAINAASAADANDCAGLTLNSQDYNLIEDPGNCTINGTTLHDLTGIDPKILPLFDYGSGNLTHALLPESPARAAANPATPGSGGNACAVDDERGAQRAIVAARCDIGAYQYYADFTVNTTADLDDDNPGDGLCHTSAGTCSVRAAFREASNSAVFRTIAVPAGDYPLLGAGFGNAGLTASSNFPLLVVGAGSNTTRIHNADNHPTNDWVISASTFNSGVFPALALARVTLADGQDTGSLTGSGLGLYQMPTLLYQVSLVNNTACYGGLSLYQSDVHAYEVLVMGNTALIPTHDPACETGGGIYVGAQSTLYLYNSTVGGNRAHRSGGGIFVDGGDAYLSNATIAGNVADTALSGGGVARGTSGGNIYMHGSILADNTSGTGSADDCAAVISSQGYNLVRTLDNCSFGSTTGDITAQDPKLSPLMYLGGPTRTYGLWAGSPALNKISKSVCNDVLGNGLRFDQRDMQRAPELTTTTWCDIGAFEGTSDVIFADGVEL